MKRLALILGLALVLLPAVALGQTIDFSGGTTSPEHGSWSWSGVPGDLTGTSSGYNDTTANGLALPGAVWTWDTGSSTSGSSPVLAYFSSGTIEISGDSGDSPSDEYCSSGTCFSGTFFNGAVLNLGGTYLLEGNFTVGYVDPYLLNVLGLPPNPSYGYQGTFSADLDLTHDTVSSLDLSMAPVPEPGTLTLLGTGLLGLAAIVRRRLKR